MHSEPSPAAAAATAELLRALLPSAVLAPSRHNSQPWLFEIEGPELRVYADVRRALPVADPAGRELVLACAGALENLRVAVRHAGLAATVELLASRAGGLVGRLRVEEPRPPEEEEDALFGALARRRTNRRGYDDREPPPGLVARLARDAADAGAILRPVEPGERRAVVELVVDADRRQGEEAAYRAEQAAWTRRSDARAADGVPARARGLSDAALLVARVLGRAGRRAAADDARDRQHLLHAPSLLALATRGDGPRDWAVAGVAFERALLRATAAGLTASYYSAVIQLPAPRARLCEILGGRAFPQVLFRIGYGPELPATPRRPVEEVLRAFRPYAPPESALAPRA